MTNFGGIVLIGLMILAAGAIGAAVLATVGLGVALAGAVASSWLTDVEFYISAPVAIVGVLIALPGGTALVVHHDKLPLIVGGLVAIELVTAAALVVLPIGVAGLIGHHRTGLDWSRAAHVPAIGWVVGFFVPVLAGLLILPDTRN